VWQTDPAGFLDGQRTGVVPTAGNYESFAFDDRGGGRRPTFFTTEDTRTGPVVRFIPDDTAMDCFNSSTPSDRWCTLSSGRHSFLKLSQGNCQSGIFSWDGANREQGIHYPNAEGIDCRGMFSSPQCVFTEVFSLKFSPRSLDGTCYFVSKADQCLYALNLDSMTYTASSTVSGAFNRQPDQIKAALNHPLGLGMYRERPNVFLFSCDLTHFVLLVYFCEDGAFDCGIHARDGSGRFFSIIDGPGFRTET
jgi:hypothetical protein